MGEPFADVRLSDEAVEGIQRWQIGNHDFMDLPPIYFARGPSGRLSTVLSREMSVVFHHVWIAAAEFPRQGRALCKQGGTAFGAHVAAPAQERTETYRCFRLVLGTFGRSNAGIPGG
jgi:hypothetical protein